MKNLVTTCKLPKTTLGRCFTQFAVISNMQVEKHLCSFKSFKSFLQNLNPLPTRFKAKSTDLSIDGLCGCFVKSKTTAYRFVYKI